VVAAVLAAELLVAALLALVAALLVAAVLALAAGLLVAAVLALVLGAALAVVPLTAAFPPQAARDTAPTPATIAAKKRRRERSAFDGRPDESMQHPPLPTPRHTIKLQGYKDLKRPDRIGDHHRGMR
jgi:hypothetical protein